MATVEAPAGLGIAPIEEFDGIFDIWPRGERLDAIHDAARKFRSRFAVDDNRVRAIKTVDLKKPPHDNPSDTLTGT